VKIKGFRIRGAAGLNKEKNLRPFSEKPISKKAKLQDKAKEKVTTS
jgi:hypothetical protein